jgi:hypothetical protein
MNRTNRIIAIASSPVLVLGIVLVAFGAGDASVPNTFVNGTTAQAAQVNANFQALVDQITANVPRRTRLEYNLKAQGVTSSTVLTWTKLRTFGSVTKYLSETDLIVDLNTNVWVNGVSAQLQLRIDDADDGTANGGMLVKLVTGSAPVQSSASTRSIFKGIPAGTRTVTLWMRSLDGGSVAVSENDDQVDRTVFIEESPSR